MKIDLRELICSLWLITVAALLLVAVAVRGFISLN